MGLYQTKKLLQSQRNNQQNGNLLNGRKYLQIIYLIRSNTQNIQNSSNSKIFLIKKWAKDLNRYFSKENIKMGTWKEAQYHSSSGKCKPKPQWGFSFTPVRIAITKKSRNDKCYWGCGKNGTLVHTGRNINWYSHCRKKYGKIPQKTKNRTIKWSSNLTSGYISKGNKIRTSKRYLHFHVQHRIIHNNQDTETT